MAINFPASPTTNQLHTSGGKTWRWTGTVWAANTDVFTASAITVAALDINCGLGNYFIKTIAGASTFTFSNSPGTGVSYSFTLELTHTSGAVTWPASVKWPGDIAPTLTTGKTHLFVFITDDGGTRWRGSYLPNYTN